jgi:hypothetical protein
LEFSPENRALKSRGNYQIKSRSPILRAIAGVALIESAEEKIYFPPTSE